MDTIVPLNLEKVPGEKNLIGKNKLAVHFRNINMLLVVFILVSIMAVSAFMISTLTENASKSHVHSYTMESVFILASYLNREITLVRQAAQSGMPKTSVTVMYRDIGNT